MGMFERLFGGRPGAKPVKAANSSQVHSELKSGHSQSQAHVGHPPTQHERRELLRVVLRDTLKRHGIPAEWITAEMATMTSRNGDRGLYWRLAIRHWDARLPVYCVSLQKALISKLHTFDPVAEEWLVGISWQFTLADDSGCPPLPHPGMWTAMPRDIPDTQPSSQPAPAQGADVIAGPVSVESHSGDVKADLERLMSVLDEQYHHAESSGYARTEPAKL
ncbi:MAG: hypothetical protein HY854_12600 [Burkholderiales bacterium]|nr:hypothetical protein [Burkholderiales bacterium]